MTDRLYYDDPYLREFEASVTAVEPLEHGLAVTLDRTAFYPTSGGQPFDTGTLESLPVIDVSDDDGGGVRHVVRNGALQVGQRVRGSVDWPRRFDHMQQHTGQHVLSAAFVHLFRVPTLSFHLGAAVSTIDLAREMTTTELAAAETDANRIVWSDRPVTIRYASAEEASTLNLRKEPARTGMLRIIEVEGFDVSACGGTHVQRTGAIGVVAIASWERFKGGQRIEFLCGGRALDRFRILRDGVGGCVRLLSVTAEELPASIERLQGEAREQKRALASLHTELAQHRAAALASSARPIGTDLHSFRVVLHAVDADAGGLKSIAAAVTQASGFMAVLISTASPSLVVVARSADVAVPANQVLAALVARFGGRGGGKPELAQGGGLAGGADDILAAALDAIQTRALTEP